MRGWEGPGVVEKRIGLAADRASPNGVVAVYPYREFIRLSFRALAYGFCRDDSARFG